MPNRQTYLQIFRRIPLPLNFVFRTSIRTSKAPTSGMMLATIKMGANEYLSDTQPTRYVEIIVSIPAAVPLMPLTDATELLWKISDGKTSAIVQKVA